MATIIQKLKSKKAQQMVEMALILPVIIMAIGIMITAAQLGFAKNTCQQAAYEGARKAVVMDNVPAARAAANDTAKAILNNGFGIDMATFTPTFSPQGGWTHGTHLHYSVKVNVKTLFPVLNTNFTASSSTPVTGNFVAMVERNK